MKRLFAILAVLLALTRPLFGAAQVVLMPIPHPQFLGSTALPLAAGKLCSYQAGTSTPQATYTDSTGVTQNANPTVLDSGGFTGVWLDVTKAYKLVLYDSTGTVGVCNGNLQWSVDNITAGFGPGPFTFSGTAGGLASGALFTISQSNASAGNQYNLVLRPGTSDSRTNINFARDLSSGPNNAQLLASIAANNVNGDHGMILYTADSAYGAAPVGEIDCCLVGGYIQWGRGLTTEATQQMTVFTHDGIYLAARTPSAANIVSISRNGANLVTLVTATALKSISPDVVRVSGITGGATSFNGVFTGATIGGTTITYTQTGGAESGTVGASSKVADEQAQGFAMPTYGSILAESYGTAGTYRQLFGLADQLDNLEMGKDAGIPTVYLDQAGVRVLTTGPNGVRIGDGTVPTATLDVLGKFKVASTGVVTSTVAPGTAPLVIASTTPVANLTVQKGNSFASDTLTATGQITSTLAIGTAPFVITSTTPVANLTTVPTTYNPAGTQQTAVHIVEGTCTLGTNCNITLTGAAAFTSATSYGCGASDFTSAGAVKIIQASTSLTITGTGTDIIQFTCVGN